MEKVKSLPEANWETFRTKCVPLLIPETQLKALREAFMLGQICSFGNVVQACEKGGPEKGPAILAIINSQLDDVAKEFEATIKTLGMERIPSVYDYRGN